jgi:nucleoid DNA-binding protein
MNRGELIEVLANKNGFTKAFAGRVLTTVIETIRAEVAAGGEVRIRKFGAFQGRGSHGRVRAKFDDAEKFFGVLGPPTLDATPPRPSLRCG